MAIRQFRRRPVSRTAFVLGGGGNLGATQVGDAVFASAALPAVLPPVAIGGELFIDGGVVDNVPVARALGLADVTRVYVLHVGNFDRPRPEPRRPIDVLLQAFSIDAERPLAVRARRRPRRR